ncbi:MAG: hypothetical protein M1838_001900 [Thelocarpon superellum]|nr:MAG: hypothetical protein M1838_001900 [Thelocarpon superellum]
MDASLHHAMLNACAWPGHWLVRQRQPREEVARAGRRRGAAAPVTVKRRKRALTPPRWTAPSRKAQRTYWQSECVLFAKLPPEVRRLIWLACLGGMTLRLNMWDRRISCDGPPSDDPHRIRPLSLLLTCRRVYAEAIDLLYASNQFELGNPDCLERLPRLLLPQRMHAIRRLRFTWHLSEPPFCGGSRYKDTVWTIIWQVLASMKGLRELQVELQIACVWRMHWLTQERKLLEPVKAVTTPDVFELTLPFTIEARDITLRELPCIIQQSCDLAEWALGA